MKRGLRFSVRTLLLLMTAAAIGLGVFVARVERQRRAMQAVLAAGGHVAYDFEYNSGGKSITSKAPAWLLQGAGHDYFHQVWVVHLNWPDCDGSGLSQAEIHRLLKDLPHLRRLRLGGADNETLALVGRMKGLKQLDLYCASAVTDEGIARLEPLEKLESLQLCDSRITNEGVASIAKHKALTRILLESAPQVTDNAVASLARNTSLEHLTITGSRIGDRGAVAVALTASRSFQSLKLDGSRMTAEGKWAVIDSRFPPEIRQQIRDARERSRQPIE